MGINDDWRVTEFVEKPADPPSIPGQPKLALASMGIYVFNAPFLYEQLARDTITPASSHDFGKDLIPHMVPRYRVYAQRFDDSCVGQQDKAAYWRDVGTVDAYWESNMDLTRSPGSQHVRQRMADMDAPGTTAPGQIRVR
jgi:glucose-1-phosphate adenylyltransferase